MHRSSVETIVREVPHVNCLLFEPDPQRFEELDRQIEMGWGTTPGAEIPLDWRTRRGPDRGQRSPEARAAISAGMFKFREQQRRALAATA